MKNAAPKEAVAIEPTEIFPPAASADGKRNAYYHDCKPLEQKRAFAACLYAIDQYNAGTLSSVYADCEKALRTGQCRAIGMREQEVLQGRAIYFIERKSELKSTGTADSIKHFFANMKDAIKGAFKPEPAAPVPVAPKQPAGILGDLAAIGGGDLYAMAITDMAKEAVVSKPYATGGVVEPLKEPALMGAMPKIEFLPGESPLEAARRMKAQQTAKQE